jgi:hypothetical protein
VLFFALAAGSILFVVLVLAAVCRRYAMPVLVAWMILVGLIPYVGALIILGWTATDSQVGDNKYGPHPYRPGEAPLLLGVWAPPPEVHWGHGALLRRRIAELRGGLVLRAVAWQTILRASYPDARPAFRSVLGAYVAGVAVNSVIPARSGDLVKLYLIRHRIPGSHYPTLAPTLAAETVFDFFVAGALMIWALAIGVLPTHQVYSRSRRSTEVRFPPRARRDRVRRASLAP